jgi:hypothetical protein
MKSLDFTNLEAYVSQNQYDIQQKILDETGWALVNKKTQFLLNKLRKTGITLGEYVNGNIYYGIKTGLNEAFVINELTRKSLIAEDHKSVEIIKPFLFGKEIKRYKSPINTRYLILLPKGWTNTKNTSEKDAWKWLQISYPAIANYLKPFSEKAQLRYDKGDYWWELRACDYYDQFEEPKLMLPDISNRGNCTLDAEGQYYCGNTAYIIANSEKYLIAILNSSLITFFYRNISSIYRGGYLRFIYQYLVTLPIRTIDFSNSADKTKHDQIVRLVNQMLTLNKQLSEAQIPHQKDMLKRQIEATDKQIDQLVYKLYDLTEEEIKIVENETSK